MTDVVTVTLHPAIDRTITISGSNSGSTHTVVTDQAGPGGKGINVAAMLADAGLRVSATGFLGRENVDVFEKLFAEKRVADHFERIAGETRTNIKLVDPTSQQTTEFNFDGPAPSPANLAGWRATFDKLDAGWFVISGSIPPGVATTLYRDLITYIQSRGRKVLLDTSGDALRHALEAKPDIVKPNIHELEQLFGAPLAELESRTKAARSLVERGIKMVVVSLGEEGALFVTQNNVVLAVPPSIEIHSPVGAGDALVSGIVSAQLRSLPLADCARVATAFSLTAISRHESGKNVMKSVEEFMPRIVVTEMS